jgi:hypothetical protein
MLPAYNWLQNGTRRITIQSQTQSQTHTKRISRKRTAPRNRAHLTDWNIRQRTHRTWRENLPTASPVTLQVTPARGAVELPLPLNYRSRNLWNALSHATNTMAKFRSAGKTTALGTDRQAGRSS